MRLLKIRSRRASHVQMVSQVCPSRQDQCGLDSECCEVYQPERQISSARWRCQQSPQIAAQLDMTALLASFEESRYLKPALDLPKGLGSKPPQPLPRPCEPSEDASPGVPRSGALKLPSSWRGPPLRSRLDWRHPLRGIEKHTTFLQARPSQRTLAS